MALDVARNISLSHVPDDTDIAVCTDLVEILLPGWRQALEGAWQPDANQDSGGGTPGGRPDALYTR